MTVNGTPLHLVNRPSDPKAKRIAIDGDVEMQLCANYHGMQVEELYHRPGTELWVSEIWPVFSQTRLLALYRVNRDLEAIVNDGT